MSDNANGHLEPYDYRKFGPIAAKLIVEKGYKNANQLALEMGVSRNQIAHHLKEGSNPSIKTFFAIANALHVTPGVLLGLEEADELSGLVTDENEQRLIEKFRQVDDKNKELVLNFIDILN